MAKYKYNTLVCARVFAVAAVLLCGLVSRQAAAQTDSTHYFTLTNGNIWWIDGYKADLPREDDPLHRYVRGWDKSQHWAEIHTLGNHSMKPTNLITSQGEVYLALEITYDEETHEPSARIVNRLVAEGAVGDYGVYGDNSKGFTPYCAWYRTNNTGYYYQEWLNPYNDVTYRYYLTRTADNELTVYINPVGEGMEPVTYWYDWDFGAAAEVVKQVGNNDVKENYWISFDTTGHSADPINGTWGHLSGDSYQRPDEIIYNPYHITESQNTDSYMGGTPNMTYYDNRVLTQEVSGQEQNVRNIPAVMPAAVMPVKVVNHEREIESIDGGINGFRGKIATAEGDLQTLGEVTEVKYLESLVVEPIITYTEHSGSSDRYVHMEVIPEYRLCVEEKYRRGIFLDYTNRQTQVFGSAGEPEYDYYYYWPHSYGGEWLKHNVKPDNTDDYPTIDSISATIDNRSRRYLKVAAHLNNHENNYRLTIQYAEPSEAPTTSRIVATVHYSNQTTQTDTLVLHLTFDRKNDTILPKRAPVIRGSVFGGGRVANVGLAVVDDRGTAATADDTLYLVGGNTKITIHSADSIYALYGGNDIAGWVEGKKGAALQIGTELTDEQHPVNIGWAYGGGCGYYRYDSVYDATAYYTKYAEMLEGIESPNATQIAAAQAAANATAWGNSQIKGLGYGNYCFRGGVYDWVTGERVNAGGYFDYAPYQGSGDFAFEENGLNKVGSKLNGTVPYIRTSHINVGVSDTTDPYHYLHNDYVKIDSLFGGAENAFIGVTATSGDVANAVTLDINGGTIMAGFGGNNYGGSVAQTSTVLLNVWNTKLTGEENIENTYLSGYGRDFGIRHLFGGGNLVQGSHANVVIHGGMVDTVFLGGNRATVDKAYGTIECLREYDGSGNPIVDRFGNIGHFIWTNPTTDTANNCVKTSIDDWEGDLGRYNVRCMFGGNNAADMDQVALIQLHSGGVSTIYGGGNAGDMNNDASVAGLPSIYGTLLGKAFDSEWDGPVPQKVGAIVTSLHDSKIICEYVYGGCRQANVLNSCGVYAAGGAFGYLNGGNDVSGDVGSKVSGAGTYVVVDSNAVVFGDIYSGSDGFLHCNDGEGHFNEEDLYDTYSWVAYDEYHDHVGKLLPTHNNTNLYIKGGLVKGNVYGGGINASVGFQNAEWPIHYVTDPSWAAHSTFFPAAGPNNGRVHTVMKGGRVEGQFFGGGFMASVYGQSYLSIKGTAEIEELYAGNDVSGSIVNFGSFYLPPSPAHPTGIAAADFYNSIGKTGDATKDSLNTLNVYNSTANKWEAKFSTYLRIEGTPRIGTIFGSGNGAWNYDGDNAQYPDVSICKRDLGNRPHQASAFIDINTSGGYIERVFGGGNGAGVSEDKLTVMLNTTTPFNENSTHMEDLATSEVVSKKLFVGTIFGGNNFDPMTACVPNIRLEKGCVMNVYGGSNAGLMGWHTDKYDVAGNKVEGVTTYVKVESDQATITDSLFGGCRMSDVQGLAYVDVRNTTASGINYLYGGNDISGTIERNTRVDISGGTVHHIWGGSNGRYDFVHIGDNEFKVYPFGTVAVGDTLGKLIAVAPKPDVDSTQVNLWGGTITSSVYAGGSMADCRSTYLDVDDRHFAGEHPLTISGSVYGGGEGYWYNLNAERRGNVTGNTDVHLRHANNIVSAKAYGGGRGGDVRNTKVTTYSTWDKPFKELYGGCWGSDVTGTANLHFEGVNLVDHLYGGNDFTGNVYKSVIDVYSGRFKNIYGGGNGAYPHEYYTTNHLDALNSSLGGSLSYGEVYSDRDGAVYNITVPNTEYVELNFYNGKVDSCIYGGGRMGTVMTYKRKADGTYDLVSRKPSDEANYPKVLKVPDTNLTWDLTQADRAHKDPTKYAYIIFNMHGGTVDKNIFAGGCGNINDATQKPIVYGLKNLNMDGGYVEESVYGGSEFVHDGYKAECTDHTSAGVHDRTTRRPSSIVNVTGGTINGFLYGAGYLGDIYGSTYINVGKRAIDTSMAYRRTYADSTLAYAKFKPGVDNGYVAALGDNNDLFINHSIYGGANWGTNTGSTDFTKESYHGGESRIIVDGYGYNTANSGMSGQSAMNIRKSIIGSGTSAEGGDIVTDVVLRDYGAVNNCAVTKQLESIQRADSLMFHRTAVELTGSTDAQQAFVSEEYSVKNIKGSMNFRGYNVVQFDATVDQVDEMHVYDEERNATTGQLVHTALNTLNSNTITPAAGENNPCDSMCAKTNLVDKTDHQNTLLILAEGIDMNIQSNNNYGNITGYSYVTTPKGYSSTMVAKSSKTGTEYAYEGYGKDYDGFVAVCEDKNLYIGGDGTTAQNHGADDGPVWNTTGPAGTNEHKFLNYNSDGYRVWVVGEGIRKRQTSILAHTCPDSLERQNVSVKFNTTTHGITKLALAQATVTLPATTPGSYYKFNDDFGFVLNGENAPLNLVDSAWLTSVTNGIYANNDDPSIRHYHQTGVSGHYEYEDDGSHGSWVPASLTADGVKTGVVDIKNRPNNTFGLVMEPLREGGNFSSTIPVEGATSSLVITGNSYVNVSDHYCSPTVTSDAGARVLPTMKFYMLYDTTFTSNFLGSVRFTLDEYNSSNVKQGEVEIEVFISTIVSDFKDIEDKVLAMFNAGRTNNFTRKVVLPAVMEERDLYITDVAWIPTDGNGNGLNPATLNDTTDRFYLVPNVDSVLSVWSAYPKDRIEVGSTGHYYAKSHNRFSLSIVPGENLVSDINAVLGWNNIDMDTINIYKLANGNGDSADRVTRVWNTDMDPDTVLAQDLTNGGQTAGVLVGTLNGRGSTVLNVNLGFDGERVYDGIPGKGFVGKVIVGFQSVSKDNTHKRFNLTINVKTREHGDTIYVATAENYVERDGVRVFPYSKSYKYNNASQASRAILIGKSPNCYVHNFQQALGTGVYEEGDVVAILDTVFVQNGKNLYIQGADGPAIEVIRYDGHHHELPGEGCVYRGPMIVATGNNTVFSAKNIAFHGGAGAQMKSWPTTNRVFCDDVNGRPLVWADFAMTCKVPYGNTTVVEETTVNVPLGDYHPDTNVAYGPIIQAKNNANVYLADGTTVMHNWNGYGSFDSQITADSISNNSARMGAVSVTGGATLHLQNDVTFQYNLLHTFDIDDRDNRRGYTQSRFNPVRPANGAIYIDGGTMVLNSSNDGTSIDIKDNFLMDPWIHDVDGPYAAAHQEEARWWTYYPDPAHPETATRWIVHKDKFFDWPLANVYLTRTAPATGTDTYKTMKDNRTDRIVVAGMQSTSSRIGVRKWFPGPDMRDTILFATYSGGDNSVLADAVSDTIFSSDDGHLMFYSTKVDNTLAYLLRCVTFQHQYYLASGAASDKIIDPLGDVDFSASTGYDAETIGDKIKSSSPLEFAYFENSCPHGGDSIFYHVQGGFAPYTFTWTDPGTDLIAGNTDDKVLFTNTSSYANNVVQNELRNNTLSVDARLAKYLASVTDTAWLPYEEMSHLDSRVEHDLRVTAVDATGQCKVYKDIHFVINRDWDETPAPVTYMKSDATQEQIDVSTVNDNVEATYAWKTTPTDGWVDTARTKRAIASRNYKSIKVNPQVWVDRTSGIVSATVGGIDYVFQQIDEHNTHELSTLYFCDGDVIALRAKENYETVTPNNHFIMWDFDPYYRSTAFYVVPANSTTVTAYYGPDGYWKDTVNSPTLGGVAYYEGYDYNPVSRPPVAPYHWVNSDDDESTTTEAGYVVTYNGDVHIYNENGLAWFISSVNGLNGTQARTFRYNKVYLHQKSGGYDMRKFLWTPAGSLQHPFRGWLRGTTAGVADTAQLAPGQKVVIKNIIVNEPTKDYAGLFGIMDTARISGIKISGAMVRGSQYVGALAGKSTESKVMNVTVADSAVSATDPITTVLVSHYASGGLVGWTKNDVIKGTVQEGAAENPVPDTVFAKFIGDAVYSGGVAGYGESSDISNHVVFTQNRLNGLYLGGIVGSSKAVLGPQRGPFGLFGRKTGNPSVISNNYVRIFAEGNAQRVGGIAGYAENTIIENNYVYGQVEGTVTDGAVAGVAANGTDADRNYYAEGSAKGVVGLQTGGDMGDAASFEGSGNAVVLEHRVAGMNNLTRALNLWVREKNAEVGSNRYITWRSDLDNVNSGYPIFGEPDMIPVHEVETLEDCEQVEWNNMVFTSDTSISLHVIDSILMVDSTLHLNVIIHHGSQTHYADSATVAEGYEGYGFSVSPAEAEMLRSAIDSLGSATIVLADTLAGEYGCDSIITLTLTFTAGQGVVNVSGRTDIRLYPNPTLSVVTIEAEGMSRLELYDNEGRRLADFTADGDKISIDLSGYSTGIYYIRIHTPSGVTIQKVIKK